MSTILDISIALFRMLANFFMLIELVFEPYLAGGGFLYVQFFFDLVFGYNLYISPDSGYFVETQLLTCLSI